MTVYDDDGKNDDFVGETTIVFSEVFTAPFVDKAIPIRYKGEESGVVYLSFEYIPGPEGYPSNKNNFNAQNQGYGQSPQCNNQ